MPKRNSELIENGINKAIRTGEIPYQANRKAVKALDIENNFIKGDRELKVFLTSIGVFTKDLEGLANVAESVGRGLSSGIR